MSIGEDLAHLQERARRERIVARQHRNQAARLAHLQLAEAYERRAVELLASHIFEESGQEPRFA